LSSGVPVNLWSGWHLGSDPRAVVMEEVASASHRNQNILRSELVDQCWLAELAAHQLRAALALPTPQPDSAIPRDRLVRMTQPEAQTWISWKLLRWSPVQAILESAAFASSILCLSDDDNTPKTKPKLEGERLRRVALARLLVGEVVLPPLVEIKERTVRNQLIHTGEKVTRWAEGREVSPGRAGLGSWGWGRGPREMNYYRWLDEENWDLTVNDRSCNLKRMVRELNLLAEALPIMVAVERPSTDGS
jgi:hypothetical protein